jgi:phage terminase small subunit
MAISEKHKLFCEKLLEHRFNQTRAYMDVYPKCKTPRINASRLLTNANVKKHLEIIKKKYGFDDLVKPEDLISDLQEIKARCLVNEPVMEYDKESGEYMATGEYQFRENGALKAIELLGKYKAMWTDKTINENTNTTELTFQEVAEAGE